MENAKFILAIFDFKVNEGYEKNEFIQTCIEYLRTKIYKNRSIHLSKRTLLIRVFDSKYSLDTEDIIEDAICDVIEANEDYFFSSNPLVVQCIKIEPQNISILTRDFNNEIKYLEERHS